MTHNAEKRKKNNHRDERGTEMPFEGAAFTFLQASEDLVLFESAMEPEAMRSAGYLSRLCASVVGFLCSRVIGISHRRPSAGQPNEERLLSLAPALFGPALRRYGVFLGNMDKAAGNIGASCWTPNDRHNKRGSGGGASNSPEASRNSQACISS